MVNVAYQKYVHGCIAGCGIKLAQRVSDTIFVWVVRAEEVCLESLHPFPSQEVGEEWSKIGGGHNSIKSWRIGGGIFGSGGEGCLKPWGGGGCAARFGDVGLTPRGRQKQHGAEHD